MTPAEAAALTAQVALEIGGGLVDEDAKYYARLNKTHRAQNPHIPHEPADRQTPRLGGNTRKSASGLARFANPAVREPVPRASVALDRRHPALREGRTIFPTRVFAAGERPRVLISGVNNAKIGGKVTKGAWAGMPIYTLSLEERWTCPRTCAVWDCCYGNGMPMAVRFRYDDALLGQLERELAALNLRHHGFVVRLHVLGDFPDTEYVRRWMGWHKRFQNLHVWGYTARARDSEIGRMIRLMNAARADRWAVRFSVAPGAARTPMQAAVLWELPATGLATVDDEVVCPQELGLTRTCGTCGLCWNPDAAHLRVLFMGHGRSPAAGYQPREIRP